MEDDAMKRATKLDDLNIVALDTKEMVNPVIVVHAPRESGSTSLIGSLISVLPGIDGAVVLSDRAVASSYMNNSLPPQLVLNKPADKVLKRLITVQQHHIRTFPGEPLPRIALAFDDIFYNAKILKSEDFQRDVKIAKDFNITIIMATADINIIPNNVLTFGTHVVATKVVSSDEIKLLHKRLFVQFNTPLELGEVLSLCRPYEFLVGLLRQPAQGTRSLERSLRRISTLSSVPHIPIAPGLAEKLSLSLDKV